MNAEAAISTAKMKPQKDSSVSRQSTNEMSSGGQSQNRAIQQRRPMNRPVVPGLLSYRRAMERRTRNIPISNVAPLPHETIPGDLSLHEERNQTRNWTLRFVTAAFTPIDVGLLSEEQARMETYYQGLLEESLARGDFDLEHVSDALSRMFPAIWRIHEGIMVNDDVEMTPLRRMHTDDTLRFDERLAYIENYLRKHKWIVLQVIHGMYVTEFIRDPLYWASWFRRGLIARMKQRELQAANQTGPSHGTMQDEQKPSSSTSQHDLGIRDTGTEQAFGLGIESVTNEDLGRAYALVDDILNNR